MVRLRGEGDGERPGGRRRPHPVLPRGAAHRLLLLRRQGTECIRLVCPVWPSLPSSIE